MIRSARQYLVTKRRLAEFEAAIGEFDVSSPPIGVSPLAHRAALEAMESMREELSTQLRDFDALRTAGVKAVKFEGLADLPSALVATRIARGMSQRELAESLDVAQQQIQRWEADDYEKAGLAYVLEIGEVLGFDEVITKSSREGESSSALMEGEHSPPLPSDPAFAASVAVASVLGQEKPPVAVSNGDFDWLSSTSRGRAVGREGGWLSWEQNNSSSVFGAAGAVSGEAKRPAVPRADFQAQGSAFRTFAQELSA